MKILLLHNYYQFSGGEDGVVEAEKTLLEAKGHEVILLKATNHEITSTLDKMNAALGSIYSFSSKQRLFQTITNYKPDVVHIHNFFPLFSPSIYHACRKAGVPVVQTLHNYRLLCLNAYLFREGKVCEDCIGKPIPIPGVMRGCYRDSKVGSAVVATMLSTHRIIQTWTQMVDVYIALTEFSRQKFIQNNLPAKKLVVKPNFVYPEPGLGSGQGNYALFVGRLSSEKGLDTLLEAWKTIGNKLPLKVVGDGPLAEEIAQVIDKIQGVEWLGRKPSEEVYALLKDAEFLVFPSKWYEGLPRIIIEAYACGTPVISSNLGSMKSLVNNGATGLLFDVGNPKDLAEKVNWALANKEQMIQMRSLARAEFEAKYTSEKNYHMLMQIYEQAISQSNN
jgi:glycosyltransferase involved in cell wall biosynthesis